MLGNLINRAFIIHSVIIEKHIHLYSCVVIQLHGRNIAVVLLHQLFHDEAHLLGAVVPINKGVLVVKLTLDFHNALAFLDKSFCRYHSQSQSII